MKLIFSKRSIFIIISTVVVFLSGCSQYEYSSPTPGTLTIKLRAYYTQFDTVFQNNNFSIKVSEIKAYRVDGVYANVLTDVKAIPPASGGTPVDVYNVLGKDAYDSLLVIGQYYLPPAEYVRLQFRIQPGPACVLDGYRSIQVDELPSEDNIVEIVRTFRIEEAKTTSMVVTIDMDETLQRLAYTFLYQPRFFVSSELMY